MVAEWRKRLRIGNVVMFNQGDGTYTRYQINEGHEIQRIEIEPIPLSEEEMQIMQFTKVGDIYMYRTTPGLIKPLGGTWEFLPNGPKGPKYEVKYVHEIENIWMFTYNTNLHNW